MELLVVGCSHWNAPLEVRESVAFAPDQVREALRVAHEEKVLDESAILSTCNRTEIYALSRDPDRGEAYVRDLVQRFKGSDVLAAGPYGYSYRDRATVRHLFRVSAGLDSMKLGEIQILSQVKDAFQMACEGGSAGVLIHRLLSAALRVGKRSRAETEIGVGSVSIASAAVDLAGKVFSRLSDKRILVIGAGETGRLAAQHFAELRPVGLTIANRTVEKAMAVAAQLGGEPMSLAGMPAALARADVVVCATGAPGAVVTYEMVAAAMRTRGSRPLVFVDIAVPRDVDPAVARIDNVFVHTIDALRTIVDQNLARRQREVPRVEAIVDDEVERFFRWMRALEVTPVVVDLRERFETIRREELERHLRHFAPADHQRLEALTRGLVNKLLHRPTTRIKSLDPDSEDGVIRLETVRALFDLDV